MIGKGGRILVTGASGFLGPHVIASVKAAGYTAIPTYRDLRPDAVPLDLSSVESVNEAVERATPEIIIHCAAYGLNYAQQDLNEALEVNVHGSLRLLDAAKRFNIERFIHIGTCFEYGSYDTPIRESFALNPTAVYGASKAAGALLLKQRASALGIPLIIARLFSFWGPNDASHHLVPQIIAACSQRKPLQLSPCEMIRDYMYVEDVADCILKLALLPKLEHEAMVVNIASGRGVTLRDFILSIARELEGEHLMQFGAQPYRRTEMKSLVADITTMQELIGEPRETSLQVGLRRTIASYVSA